MGAPNYTKTNTNNYCITALDEDAIRNFLELLCDDNIQESHKFTKTKPSKKCLYEDDSFTFTNDFSTQLAWCDIYWEHKGFLRIKFYVHPARYTNEYTLDFDLSLSSNISSGRVNKCDYETDIDWLSESDVIDDFVSKDDTSLNSELLEYMQTIDDLANKICEEAADFVYSATLQLSNGECFYDKIK